SRATHSVAVLNATRWPARQARIPSAIARWVLPVPGGPSSTTFSFPARKSSWPRCSAASRRIEAWKAKSKSSSVLRAGNRACLMRAWPPWLSRLSISVLSSTSAKRSNDHSSARARSASLGGAQRWASASRATHSVAVLNATRWPARQARIPGAIARWVLPVPGGPSSTTFSRRARKSSWPRVQDRLAADRGLEGEVEVLERLAGGEPRLLDAGLAAVAVAGVYLGLEQDLGEALKRPFLGAGAVGELGQRPRRGRRLERPEQMRQLAGRAAHAINASSRASGRVSALGPPRSATV